MKQLNRGIQNRPFRKSRFHTCLSLMLDTMSVPAAKVIELYGFDEVKGPTRSIVQRTKALGKRYPCYAMATEVVSWSVIGFDMAYFGAQLSDKLAGMGPMLADITAYTAVMTHPSLVSAGVRSIRNANGKPGISEYIQACSIADIPSTPVFLAILGKVIHSGDSGSLGVKRAVAAVLLASILDFVVWMGGFIPYWAKVIRREPVKGIWTSIKEAVSGFIHPFRKAKLEGPYEEGGRIAGIGAVVWALPVFAMRAAAAGLLAMAGVAPQDFNQAFFSLANGLFGLVRYVATGIKNTLVGRLIEHKNHGGEHTD